MRGRRTRRAHRSGGSPASNLYEGRLGCGSFLALFTLPGGLHEDDDLALTWRRTSTRDGLAPRVRASDGALHSPGAERCERFDAASGTTLEPLELDARLGLLVTEEAFFGIGLDRITRLAR